MTAERLKPTRGNVITQNDIRNETILAIKKLFIESPTGFTMQPTSLDDLIKILKGEKEVSFLFNKQTIKLRCNFKNHEIGELFLHNPFGFLKKGKNLEQALQMLWPSLKEDLIFEEGTTIVESNESMKELIKEVLATSIPNLN